MMKKMLLTAMIASMLIVPFQSVALAENQEVSPTQIVAFLPGDVPAETSTVDAMSPAIHAVILAMVNQDITHFDSSNIELGWETLYNMLSLYGQLDERSDYLGERLVLPGETVMDFSAALFPDFSDLGTLPDDLSDRMVYNQDIDSYLLTCGNDNLADIRLEAVQQDGSTLTINGALVYLVDDSDLAQFQVTLQTQDNMFGYTITGLELL